MANTQRPPPPVLHLPAERDDLGALSDALDSAAPPPPAPTPPAPAAPVARTLPPPPPPPPPPPHHPPVAHPVARPIVRGDDDDDDVIDLAALAKLGTSAPPQAPLRVSAPPRFSEPPRARLSLDEEPVVLPRRTRPSWLMPLFIGVGIGVAIGALMFATSRGGDQPSAAPPSAAPVMATTAAPASPPAPAATVAPPAAPAVAAPEPMPAPVQAQALAAPPPGAAQLPAAALPAANPVSGARAALANPAAERSVARSTSGVMAPSRPYVGATASEPPLAPPTRGVGGAPSFGAGGPVLVVRPASEPALAPPVSTLQPMAGPQATAVPPPSAASAAPAPARPGGGSLDSLLDNALSADARHPEQTRVEAAALPVTPSREEVANAVASVQTAMRGCAMGETGIANAALSVRNDGKVTAAQVTGAPFAGTSGGRCMEGVLRSAHFPRFKQPTFSVQYPVSIQ